MAPHDVILGLDLGSTSLRAYLYDPTTEVGWCVENKSRAKRQCRFPPSDFSSKGYPFDIEECSTTLPIYLGEDFDPTRESTSLKFAFYALANAGEDRFKDYHVIDSVIERKHDFDFRHNLWLGLHELFHKVAGRVEQVCDAKNLRVASINITVPVQWSLNLSDCYRTLISQVWKNQANIFCITETEAAAHYLLKENLQELSVRRLLNKHDLVLFFDFGGHTMNSCAFHIEHDPACRPVFYQAQKPNGAGGGSEHWEYLIGEQCEHIVTTNQGCHAQGMTESHKQSILDDFNLNIADYGPGSATSIFFGAEKYSERNYYLSAETISEEFERALYQPFLCAKKDIVKLANRYGKDFLVVVTGGTSKHKDVQAKIEKLCRVHGILRKPVFEDQLEVTYGSAKIAKGATYAMASSQSVSQFFKNGAAIGLQTLQAHPDEEKINNLWDNTGLFLMSKGRHYRRKVVTEGRDEFRLICDPFFGRRSSSGRTLDHARTYDLADLGVLARGVWLLSLTYDENLDGTCHLTIKARHAHTNPLHPVTAKSARHRPTKTRVVELYYNNGANCVLLRSEDSDQESLSRMFNVGASAETTEDFLDAERFTSISLSSPSLARTKPCTPKNPTIEREKSKPTKSQRFHPYVKPTSSDTYAHTIAAVSPLAYRTQDGFDYESDY